MTLAKTALELRGQPLFEQEDPEELSKSISCSRSFGHPVVDLADLAEAVANYTARAAEKLRREKQLASGVYVYFQYYPEYTPVALPGGFYATTITFETPTSSTSEGCEIRPHEMSVICNSPSTPPRSMNAPKSVMFLTTP